MADVLEELTVPSQLHFLQDIRVFIGNALKKTNLPEAECQKVILAVDEGSSNIIEHAYGGENGFVKIRIEADKDRIFINLYDSGSTFDPNTVQAPNIEEHVRIGKKTGLGIHLIRQIMDKMVYNYKDGEYNHLQLVKYIKKC